VARGGGGVRNGLFSGLASRGGGKAILGGGDFSPAFGMGEKGRGLRCRGEPLRDLKGSKKKGIPQSGKRIRGQGWGGGKKKGGGADSFLGEVSQRPQKVGELTERVHTFCKMEALGGGGKRGGGRGGPVIAEGGKRCEISRTFSRGRKKGEGKGEREPTTCIGPVKNQV